MISHFTNKSSFNFYEERQAPPAIGRQICLDPNCNHPECIADRHDTDARRAKILADLREACPDYDEQVESSARLAMSAGRSEQRSLRAMGIGSLKGGESLVTRSFLAEQARSA